MGGLLVGIAAAVVVVGVAVATFRRRTVGEWAPDVDDLGSVSESWLAEQRGRKDS